MEQAVDSTRRKDRFFDFNMIDLSKSNLSIFWEVI